jgi:putative tricarboxylic transport membrane protein
MIIGLFAVSEVFRQAEGLTIIRQSQHSLPQSNDPKDKRLFFHEYWALKRTMLRSAIIGSFIGILPAIGGATAAFLSYGRAKVVSEHPDNFGEGELEGVCASETANNAVVGPSIVPLLTLGIPGSTTAAVLLNALIIHGLTPGPFLLVEHSKQIYSLFIGLIFATFALYVLGKIGIRCGIYITKLTIPRLFPVVLVLCLIGGYASNLSYFDLKVMIFFGILGYFMQKHKYPLAPLVISFILSPMMELSLRQSMLISRGKLWIIFNRPIVLLFCIFTVISIVASVRQKNN